MPIIPEVTDRLRGAFPESTDLALVRATREGVLLADDLYGEGNFLNNSLGRDVRGFIRRAGIAYQICRFCERGDLPFSSEMKAMPKGRWHWLEIRAPGVFAHACRTDDVYTFPDEAKSRQDLRLAIQPNLLSWSARDKSLGEVLKDIPDLYAWLTYGLAADGNLSHLCWASPAPDGDDWLAHISILQEIRKAAVTIRATTPVPDPKERLRLRDHVQQILDDTDDSKASGE